MSTPGLTTQALRDYDRTFNSTREDLALQSRGDFLKAFPASKLRNLNLDDYVIGLRKPTFCDYVEPKTRAWAVIMGATALKFGIYFGRTKSDPVRKYRYSHKFGESRDSAFKAVKEALINLVELGAAKVLDFQAIDENPLAQLVKAKVLSLYYPKRFLNVCSKEHLEMLGGELGLGDDHYASEYQHLLLWAKNQNPVGKSWSNPKFMMFLYDTFVDRTGGGGAGAIRKTKKTKHRRVDMEDMQRQWGAIGRAAEDFAIEWEKKRLRGADLEYLISSIDDRRDRPSYGYDLLSYSARGRKRYIEVKAVGRVRGGAGYRFFLSDNEHKVSIAPSHSENYFFYLVYFDGDGQPSELKPMAAKDLYELSDMDPSSYIVRFERET